MKPGFTKDEMPRPAKEDPRAPGGVFERVGGLLSELLDQGVRYWFKDLAMNS